MQGFVFFSSTSQFGILEVHFLVLQQLTPLFARRAGQHSIRINEKYRICFTWSGTEAVDVEIVDYH